MEKRRECWLSPGTLRGALSRRPLGRDGRSSRTTLPAGAAKPLFSPANHPENMVKPLEGETLTSPTLRVLDGGPRSFLEIHTNPLKC